MPITVWKSLVSFIGFLDIMVDLIKIIIIIEVKMFLCGNVCNGDNQPEPDIIVRPMALH